MLKASVILAFYNDINLLQHTLNSLNHQYHGQFEVIIADDGSKKDVVDQVKSLLPSYNFQSKHLWHPDDGFQKTVILNKAVISASTDFLIFLDADCVPQAHFVDDHLRNLTPGVCQAGRRIDTFRDAVDAFADCPPEAFFKKHWFRLLLWSMQGKARNVEKGLRLPYKVASWLPQGRAWSLVGCNFSVCKQDLLAINGFDERAHVQWGAEDSDVDRRLLKSGVRITNLRYQATMIHFDASFFRREAQNAISASNSHIFQQAQAENRAWTPFGIVKEDRADPVSRQP